VTQTSGQQSTSVAQRPPPLPPGFASQIVADSPLADAGRDLEYDIFVAETYVPESPDRRIADYRDYEARSIFHVVTAPGDEVIGVVRSVLGTYDTLPVGRYVPERWGEFPSEAVCEYATLAIRPDMRQQGIAEELYRSVFALAWRSGVSGLVALVDPWLHDLLNDYYGCQFHQIGPETDYFRGFTVRPIGVSLTTLETVMPQRVPEFWSWLAEGIDQAEIVIDLRERLSAPPVTSES
jgi:GNAT superfamily N-acetyltransferase